MASSQTTPTGHAELYRADFISLMKLPDTIHLSTGAYLDIRDPWRTEWEKGVQVCMNPESLPIPSIRVVERAQVEEVLNDFEMPSELVQDSSGYRQATQHDLYDLDEMDLGWLERVQRRKYNSLTNGQGIDENTLRMAIATLEVKCQHNMAYALTKREDLKMEVDKSAGCDVCREFEGEDSNEMVFCDGCNVCVHQACYGILKIPGGSWMCDMCLLKQGLKKCVLCPGTGGAMKATGSGSNWAHVSCALWIPEVKFGSSELMKPVLLDQVPVKRWSLICSLCRKREGACVQCCCASCTVAYHVSCAFKFGLEMTTSSENQERLVHESFCPKHTTLRKAIRTPSPKKDLGLSLKVRNLEEEFYRHASPSDLQRELSLSETVSSTLYNYWQLKRKANQNRPLVAAMSVDSLRLELLQQSQDLSQRKANFHELVVLRHSLEKLRNLNYMVLRRERLKRQLVLKDEEVVQAKLELLSSPEEMQNTSSSSSSGRIPTVRCVVTNGPVSMETDADTDGFKLPSEVSILDHHITRLRLRHSSDSGSGGEEGSHKVKESNTQPSHPPSPASTASKDSPSPSNSDVEAPRLLEDQKMLRLNSTHPKLLHHQHNVGHHHHHRNQGLHHNEDNHNNHHHHHHLPRDRHDSYKSSGGVRLHVLRTKHVLNDTGSRQRL